MSKEVGSRQRGSYLTRALVGAAMLLSSWGAPLMAESAENQCISCHETERLPISLGHSFEEWHASAHARAGIACEKCHGGQPDAKTAAEAHRGVLPASSPESLVHPQRLPQTCGSCHARELAAYTETVHAKILKKRGQGATCFTCHGSMATSLPSPSQMSERCAVCHKQPIQARAALSMLAAVKIQLHKTKRAVEATQAADPKWQEGAQQRLHEIERDYADVQLKWHRFDMNASLKESRNLLKLGELLNEEAQVRVRRNE